MAEFKELILAFKAVRDALPEVLPQAATSVSMAGKALAERTVKDKGFGEEYSTTKVPAWFMKGKELNKRGANYITGLEKRASKEDKLALSNWGEASEGAEPLGIGFEKPKPDIEDAEYGEVKNETQAESETEATDPDSAGREGREKLRKYLTGYKIISEWYIPQIS